MCMCAVNPVEVQVNLVIVLLKKMSLHLSNVLRAQHFLRARAKVGGLLHVQAQGPMVS